MAELESVLSERRAKGFESARSAVASDRCRQVVLSTPCGTSAATGRRVPTNGVVRFEKDRSSPFCVRFSTDRVKRITKKLGKLEKLDPRQRHKLRIAVKKLHYGTEIFSRPCSPKLERRAQGLPKS